MIQLSTITVRVDNIPSGVNDKYIAVYFGETLGNAVVRVNLVHDKGTGEFMHTAFVELRTSALARRALREFNGETILNKQISVSLVVKGYTVSDDKLVYLRKVPKHYNSRILFDILEPFGNLLSLYVPDNKNKNRWHNYAFATFLTAEDARRAIAGVNALRTLPTDLEATPYVTKSREKRLPVQWETPTTHEYDDGDNDNDSYCFTVSELEEQLKSFLFQTDSEDHKRPLQHYGSGQNSEHVDVAEALDDDEDEEFAEEADDEDGSEYEEEDEGSIEDSPSDADDDSEADFEASDHGEEEDDFVEGSGDDCDDIKGSMAAEKEDDFAEGSGDDCNDTKGSMAAEKAEISVAEVTHQDSDNQENTHYGSEAELEGRKSEPLDSGDREEGVEEEGDVEDMGHIEDGAEFVPVQTVEELCKRIRWNGSAQGAKYKDAVMRYISKLQWSQLDPSLLRDLHMTLCESLSISALIEVALSVRKYNFVLGCAMEALEEGFAVFKAPGSEELAFALELGLDSIDSVTLRKMNLRGYLLQRHSKQYGVPITKKLLENFTKSCQVIDLVSIATKDQHFHDHAERCLQDYKFLRDY